MDNLEPTADARPAEQAARRLPDQYVEQGLRRAQGAVLFGVPLEELSTEELRAAVANGYAAHRRALRSAARSHSELLRERT